MTRQLTVGTLFSGIGGFDLALERAGMRVVWNVEIDKDCNKLLAQRYPEVEHHDDVRRVHARDACPHRAGLQRDRPGLVGRGADGAAASQPAGGPPRRDGLIITAADHADWLAGRSAGCLDCLAAVDIVVGGSPCQDWSVAGRRAGLAGQRTGLFFEYSRIVRELAPRWFVFENVPGLLSACSCTQCRPADGTLEEDESAVATHTRADHRGADFATVLEELSGTRPTIPIDGWRNTGFGFGPDAALSWRVLDAQWFGVAQRRRRVFVVGHRGGPRSAPAQVLFDGASLQRHPPTRPTPGQAAAASAGGGAARATDGDPLGVNIRDGQMAGDVAASVQSRPPGSGPSVNTQSHIVANALRGASDSPAAHRKVNAERDGYNDGSDQTYIPMAGDDDIVHQAMSSKWAKGSSGPAGDEVHNMVVVQDTRDLEKSQNGVGVAESDVAYTVDTTGAQGVVAATPMLAFRTYPDDDDGASPGGLTAIEVDIAPTLDGSMESAKSDRGARIVQGVDLHNASDTGSQARTLGSGDAGDGPPAVMYRKAQKAHDAADVERWEEDSTVDTLAGHGTTSASAVQQPAAGGVRRLTPTECERLQGFPDGWTFGSDSTRYRQLGNAVAVPVAGWIARRLAEVEG